MNRILVTLLLIIFHLSSMSQNKELKKLFSKGKYDQVIDKAQVLLQVNATDPDLNSILGRAFTDSKQFTKAIPYLEKSIASDTGSNEIKAVSKAYLAKCYFINSEEQRAVAMLKECQNDSESKEATKYAHKYLGLFQTGIYYKAWEMIETDNLRFYFQDKKKLKNAEEYMERINLNFKRITKTLNVEPTKKVDFFVWSDRNEAFRKFDRPLGFSNSDLCIVNVWQNQTRDYELCHMLSQLALQSKFKTMLISEGLGVYFDQMDKNLLKLARLEVPKDKFSLLKLWEEPTKYERDLSYPVGAAFIEFLINKGGRENLKDFLTMQTIKHAKEVYPDFQKWVNSFEAMLMQ
ncbi:MAG: tetratricopeptide repeat protein [Labilibaculum antarcticum]